MSTRTEKLGLLKPELTDAADITSYNENWEIIDQALNEAEQSQTSLESHLSNKSNPHNVTPSQIGAATTTELSEARRVADNALNVANTKAPSHTWGTADITAGSSSSEPNGTLHLVIE